jgi:uncharacterized membrane protein SirB2
MYLTLKTIHIGFATLSIAGFILRGVWMVRKSGILDRTIVKIAPHVIDTAFLITGIWLVVVLQLNVAQKSWLIAKFIALILYIAFGAIALRRGRTMQIRTAAFIAALSTYLYIVGVALHRSAASWLA